MTIAEKLLRAKGDLDSVYTVGYEKGKSEGSLSLNEEWMKHTSSIAISDWDWVSDSTVELNLPTQTSFTLTGANETKTKNNVKHLIINCEEPLRTLGNALDGGNGWHFWGLEHITLNADTSQATDFHKICAVINPLKTVDGTPLNFSGRYGVNGQIFYNCSNLESFRVEPSTIKLKVDFGTNSKLDDATVQSVIDGLADLTDTTAQILTLHADVKTKLSDTQLAAITGKNWTLA